VTGAMEATVTPAVCLGGGFGGIILLSVVRSLAKIDVPVWVLSNRDFSPVRFSRFCRRILVPNVESDPHGLEAALSICARDLGRKPVLFVVSDAEALFVAERRHRLEQYYHIAAPTAELARDLIDKRRQYELIERWGMPMPRTYHGINASAARSDSFEFPLVIKPAISAQWALGRQKAILVEDAVELERHLRTFEGACTPVVVQSAIPGPASCLYTVVAYVNRAHEPLAWGAYRKVRQYPREFGMGAVAETVNVPALEERALQLLRDLQFTGVCGIEFKQDPRDGVFRLIEINPRFELANSLIATAGVDLARTMYADLTGSAEAPRRPYRTGISWMALNMEFKACRELSARGEFSWKEWIVSLRGLRREALLSWDDPLPGVASYLGTFRNLLYERLRSGSSKAATAHWERKSG